MNTAALAFYTALPIIAEGNVTVKYINEVRGRGLFTTVAASSGDLLFTEQPVLSLQHLGNRRYLRACEFCLRSIGTLRDQWLRALTARRADKRRRRRHRDHPDDASSDSPASDEDDSDDEALWWAADEKDPSPYTLPDPLPLTAPSPSLPPSAPLFDVSRYDVTPIPCAHGCDDLYCSASCRDRAWRQYHALLCPRQSFAPLQALPSSSPSTPALLRFLRFAEETNEIFVLVAKLIATVISAPPGTEGGGEGGGGGGGGGSPLWPFSLFQSSVWWEQVHPPSSLSPMSALRFRSTLQTMCKDCLALLLPLFPDHAPPSASPHAALFTPLSIAHVVSIFETNQLSLFAPSPLPTYLAFYHSLPPALSAVVKASLSPLTFAHTNAVSSLRIEGTGLFWVACVMNHDCDGAVRMVKRDHEREEDGFVDLDGRMSAMCVRAVGVGEEVCVSYVEEEGGVGVGREGGAMGWRERAEVLRDYGIVCTCARCEREKREEEERGEGDSDEEEEELNQFEDDDNVEDAEDAEDEDEDEDDDA